MIYDIKQAITDAKNGINRGYTFIYDNYLLSVKAEVRKYLDDEDVIDDCVSLTFTKAFKNIIYYEESLSLAKWLRTIARNTTYDYLRSIMRKPYTVSLDDPDKFIDLDIHTDWPDRELILGEHKKILYNCISLLKTRFRQILLMYVRDNLTYDEIAEQMGWDRNKAIREINKAMKALQLKIKKIRK
jgi:RNA polymerase sigma-70 factor (ECF subfamily)